MVRWYCIFNELPMVRTIDAKWILHIPFYVWPKVIYDLLCRRLVSTQHRIIINIITMMQIHVYCHISIAYTHSKHAIYAFPVHIGKVYLQQQCDLNKDRRWVFIEALCADYNPANQVGIKYSEQYGSTGVVLSLSYYYIIWCKCFVWWREYNIDECEWMGNVCAMTSNPKYMSFAFCTQLEINE